VTSVVLVIVQQLKRCVLATVMSVLVQAQHTLVQQVMLFAQIILVLVAVQVLARHLIVAPVLMIHMVYAVIQPVAAILATKHMIMVRRAQPVKPVAVALALRMFQLEPLVSIAQPPTIAATAVAPALRHAAATPTSARMIRTAPEVRRARGWASAQASAA